MPDHEGTIPDPIGSPENLPDEVMYGREVTDGDALPASPEDISRHDVDYPSSFLDEPVRELLRRSQTNVTADPELGEQYAAAAYDKARQAESGSDTTAAGEAAAKAGFRATQAGKSAQHIGDWFLRSFGALRGDELPYSREVIATYLLHGRSLALRALHDWENARGSSRRVACARTEFEGAEFLLEEQHSHGQRWDRYGTMVSRHHATFEAVFGHRQTSADIALGGMWRAIRAHRENASTVAGLIQHAKFVGKQLLMNTAALGLAVTKPNKQESHWARKHRAFAAKMLG